LVDFLKVDIISVKEGEKTVVMLARNTTDGSDKYTELRSSTLKLVTNSVKDVMSGIDPSRGGSPSPSSRNSYK